MNLELIQWNISYICQTDKICAFLKSKISNNSVVCLQEVLHSNMKKIVEQLQPSDYRFSLDMRPPGKFDGKNRKLGLLTMTFRGKITNSYLIDRSMFPERTLVTETDFEGNKVKVLNFHSLTGVGYKRGKSSTFASIAEYLHENNLDFFCCDANEPKTDAFEIENLEFWDNGDKGKYPSMIFGKEKVHNLNESFLSVKEDFSELPISYKTGKTYRRYDFIFHSTDWKVDKLEYLYEESIKATSDHALVLGRYKK
jgi:endonuclease/exonuclease/phosphatase family metal-dependent hydrolase